MGNFHPLKMNVSSKWLFHLKLSNSMANNSTGSRCRNVRNGLLPPSYERGDIPGRAEVAAAEDNVAEVDAPEAQVDDRATKDQK